MKILVFIFLLCAGCGGYHYIAPIHIVPVNYEKGHFVGNLSFNTCQLGYAFSENLSAYAMANYRYGMSDRTDNEGFDRTDEHIEINLGISYFRNYGDFASFEISTGSGYGTVKYENSYNQRDIEPQYEFSFNAKKINYSIQPSLSVRYEDFTDITIFSRINYIRYFNIESDLNLTSLRKIEEHDAYIYGRNSADLCFLEPGIQLRVGLKRLKLMLQLSGAINLCANEILYQSRRFVLGISYNFNIFEEK